MADILAGSIEILATLMMCSDKIVGVEKMYI
jgi:hypothetical protein